MGSGHLGRKSGEGFYRYDGDGVASGVAFESPEPSIDMPVATPADIVSRIRAAIDAEARLAAAEGVATPDDIDLALRLGAGHPPHDRTATIAT